MTEPTRDERIADLTEAARNIAVGVDALNQANGTLLTSVASGTKRNRLGIWALSIFAAGLLVLTGFVYNLTVQVEATQELQRSRVLCPLYQQFINADTPEARVRAKELGQDLKIRDEAYRVFHDSYNALHCGN